ncbi:MAG: threonyl-tRNA synthetase [Candidatus Woesearchaeota archaeon]|nr:threonyl-tRNA synthetase [Candidatus Woesearchaeota archaeon]
MIKIKFPDGSVDEFKEGITPKEIAEKLPSSIRKNALVAKFNGKLIDLNEKIKKDGEFELLDFNTKEGRETFWHSSSHVLAQAVKRLYPEAKLAIGPPIEEGFYYDFDFLNIGDEDIKKIEKACKQIIAENLQFKRKVVSKEEAQRIFINEPYKLELIDDLDGETISIYEQGEFVDLCRGPHLESTDKIGVIKITRLAGAYWRGDSKNKMLTRIYAISFPTEKEMKEYLEKIEEAKKRDHKKIGKEMELFDVKNEGPGFPFIYPKGMIIWNELLDYWRQEHKKAGYQEIKTPIILSRELWEISGHWDHYKDNMYFTKIDSRDFAIKPMNCPGCILVFKSKKHSYKELPLRIGEIGLVHRHELSGVLNGLFRVRSFHQDDAHIFCTEEQIESEVVGVMKLVDKFYKVFGFEYFVELSTMPENHIGTEATWEMATNKLISALNKQGFDYKINEGEGAFYGPKIDFHIKDSLGRNWQCATIQVDFSMPERFDLTYVSEDGREDKRPIMIHRVIYGSLERFIGILTENFAGKFPLWLAPVQAEIIAVSDSFNDYAEKVRDALDEAGIRVELNSKSETIGKKIREALLQRVKYIVVVGKTEEENNTINLRDGYENKVIGEMKVESLIKQMKEEIAEKKI